MAKQASAFYRVGAIIKAFIAKGCVLNVAEATAQLEDGDCFNARYLLSPAGDRFVPLIDLNDDHKIAEPEVRYWERRLGVTIPRPNS